jgi:hypothetical protein
MGAGVSFMGFAAHEMYQEPPRRASNAMADDGMVIDSEPVTWGSSKSTVRSLTVSIYAGSMVLTLCIMACFCSTFSNLSSPSLLLSLTSSP